MYFHLNLNECKKKLKTIILIFRNSQTHQLSVGWRHLEGENVIVRKSNVEYFDFLNTT